MDINQFYACLGEDSQNPLRRFGSAALLNKFLHKMLSDQTFATLNEAMEQGDQHQAFRAAHTLKGVALNLSLAPLSRVSAQLTELLRNAEPISEQAATTFGELSAVYDDIIGKLRQLDD